MAIKVKLKKLSNSAWLPEKGKKGDFCYDVWAVSEEEIHPNVWRYGLGFKYEIERGDFPYVSSYQKRFAYADDLLRHFDISIDFRPRSSICDTGMVLTNSEGTLDEFYRGEAKANFYHVMTYLPRYKVGEKIGQIKIGIAPKVEFEFVDEIDENTERGEGGFGSTGKE